MAKLATEMAVLITVHSSRGSVPREKGAWMLVFAHDSIGTVGGGHLEFQAISEARLRLHGAGGNAVIRFALGPALGQCCGGEVHLFFEPVCARDIEILRTRLQIKRHPVALFGGGHVGHALVQVMMTLPLQINWFDSRNEVFPNQLPQHVLCEHSDPVQAAVAGLAPDSLVLIMSFSHAEDLDVVAASLLRQRQQADLPYVGLIGSASKWAVFRRRLEARGFTQAEIAHITCPIGVPGISGKEPEVIAVAVAAQLLQALSARGSSGVN